MKKLGWFIPFLFLISCSHNNGDDFSATLDYSNATSFEQSSSLSESVTSSKDEDSLSSSTFESSQSYEPHEYVLRYDEYTHFYICLGCGDIQGREDHQYNEDDICTICGYQKPVTEETSSSDDDSIENDNSSGQKS